MKRFPKLYGRNSKAYGKLNEPRPNRRTTKVICLSEFVKNLRRRYNKTTLYAAGSEDKNITIKTSENPFSKPTYIGGATMGLPKSSDRV
ncbi:MAG: hypothetical protein KKD39_02100 [Candidatus Altiarchaeota archaeon]|nr:hypothetical protein [Candidatus Altiarchaeota archaeon]MBU1941619.1 hypothetical protein [Candidatus Thermoplasmatota archaeon]